MGNSVQGQKYAPSAAVIPLAFMDMLAATLRGATKATLGLPGDLEKLGRAGINLAGGSVDPDSVLSSSEDMDKHLPPLNPLVPGKAGQPHPYEKLGEFLPTGLDDVAKASLLIPIIRGRNADKLAEANLLRRAELADQLKAQGATRGDIWHDAQVSEVIRSTNRGRSFDNGKWLHEIATPKDLFSPYATMADNDKFDLLGRPENLLFAEKLRRAPAGSPEAQEYANVLANDSLIPGIGPARDGLDWPELDAQYPNILDIQMEFHPKNARMNSGSRGTFYPGINKIEVNPASMTENPNSTGSPRRVMLHEMQHGVQDAFKIPGGGSPFSDLDPQRRMWMQDLINELRALQKASDNKTFNDAEILIQQIYPQANRDGFAQYKNLMGEAQARAASERDILTSAERLAADPLRSYDPGVILNRSDTHGLADADLWNQTLGNAALGTPTDRAAMNMVNWLRRRYPHAP